MTFAFLVVQLALLDRSGTLCVEPGDVEVHVGRSSVDLPLRGSFSVTDRLELDHRRDFVTPVSIASI